MNITTTRQAKMSGDTAIETLTALLEHLAEMDEQGILTDDSEVRAELTSRKEGIGMLTGTLARTRTRYHATVTVTHWETTL